MADQRPPDDVPADVAVDAALVSRLVAEQHPDLAGLPVRAFSEGWDNALYRVGEDLLARVPRRELGARWLAKELALLPVLAPRLPVPVPVAVREGRPAHGYPYRWALTPFLPGEVAGRAAPAGSELAVDLAAFLAALHQPTEVEAHNPFRAVHPREREASVRLRLPGLPVDGEALLAAWAEAVAAPPWHGPPLWCHADLHPFNLLLRHGRLAAVLDWGDLCTGDPAPDLACAWMLLQPPHHQAVLAPYDAATRARGRAWALYFGVMLADAGQRGAGPDYVRVGLRTLDHVLSG